jgi:CRISPR/Cas system CMR-associated protein Cmr5 small subunit
MQNLEQIRAAAALKVAEKTSKADVNKLPAMIIANGLLAATAFATEPTKDGGYKRPEMAEVLNGTAQHLANPVHGLTELAGVKDARAMTKALSENASSAVLQRATTEGLAFIGYVKRFARKEA